MAGVLIGLENRDGMRVPCGFDPYTIRQSGGSDSGPPWYDDAMKTCKTCGLEKSLTEFYSNGLWKGSPKYKPDCKPCNNEAQRKRFYGIIEKHFGGMKCSLCGYDRCVNALECHHVDPAQKDIAIAKMDNYSAARIVAELVKCILVCANCHREIHSGAT
jgi:hypothetical protein